MQKSKCAAWYVKYVIKTPFVFYSFLFIGVVLFFALSMSVHLDIVQSTKAEIIEQKVVLDGEYELASDKLYLYNDKNDHIYKLEIISWEKEDGNTVCAVQNNMQLSGWMNADIITGSQTLLKRIFLRAGQG